MLSCTCQKDCLTLFSSQCIILIELKLWEVISSMIRQVYCVWHMKEVVPNFQLRLVFLMCEAAVSPLVLQSSSDFQLRLAFFLWAFFSWQQLILPLFCTTWTAIFLRQELITPWAKISKVERDIAAGLNLWASVLHYKLHFFFLVGNCLQLCGKFVQWFV